MRLLKEDKLKALLGINYYPDFDIIHFDLENELGKLTDEEKVELDNIINSKPNFQELDVKKYIWDLQEKKISSRTHLDPKQDYKFWNNPLLLLSAQQQSEKEKLLHEDVYLARMLSGLFYDEEKSSPITEVFKDMIKSGAQISGIWKIVQLSKKHFENSQNLRLVQMHGFMEKRLFDIAKNNSPYFQYLQEAEKVALSDLNSEKGKINILCFLKLTQKFDKNVLLSFLDFLQNSRFLEENNYNSKVEKIIENAIKIANKKSC